MNIGFYAGSFDPFTNGHLHIIKKSAAFFDQVIVGIGVHSSKSRHYDKQLMKNTIEQVLARENLTNVSVVIYDNLTVDAALAHNANYLIRGIRNGMDYEYEENIASVNEEISGLDTIYIRAGALGVVSSSMVRELLAHHRDVSKYVPIEIKNILE